VTAQPGEASRIRILRAAAEIAAEAGYEATTISKVTKRSGLPVSSVYWLFEDKDHLLGEVVRHSFDEWIVRQPQWTLEEGSGRSIAEGVRAILSRSVRSLPDAPDFMRIGLMLLLENREVEPEARRRMLQIRRDVEQQIAEWFRVQIDARTLRRRPELPDDLAKIVIASTDGLFLALQIHDEGSSGEWDPDGFVDLVVAVVEAALA
jgi:AcrR family transcriptional regulator